MWRRWWLGTWLVALRYHARSRSGTHASTWPVSLRHCLNATTRGAIPAADRLRYPITCIAGCCACAALFGERAALPPLALRGVAHVCPIATKQDRITVPYRIGGRCQLDVKFRAVETAGAQRPIWGRIPFRLGLYRGPKGARAY